MSTRTEPRPAASLYRLLSWLSPSFPIGSFSYSHGVEAAAAAGAVYDRATLQGWVAAIIELGSGRIDTDILRDAYRAAEAGDVAALAAANRRGIAFRATSELALEASQQGEAFLNTCLAAWPRPLLQAWGIGSGICLPAALAAAAACAGIRLDDALLGYLHAFASNLMSAGLRLGLIGQTDGQRILAALEPVIADAAAAALNRDPGDFGSATFAVDLASMAHETQYSRLFRS